MKVSDLVFSCIRSKLAYAPPHDIRSTLHHDRMMEKICQQRECNRIIANRVRQSIRELKEPVIMLDNDDTTGFIIWDTNRVYVTYRGTASTHDILNNMDIRRQKIGNTMKVHKGYFDKFMGIEEEVTANVKQICAEYPITELVFAGHSMAASIATISSPYYGEVFKDKKITTHTLGSAAVGNAAFVDWFASNVDHNVRIEAEGDIVPYIPIHPDFMHVPNGIKVSQGGQIQLHYEVRPYTYSEILCHILKDWDRVYTDHSCETYISNLFAVNV